MPRIVTRAEWGARPRIGSAQLVSIGARTATCVHHDGATPVLVRSFAEACDRVRRDQNYHMDSNGWDDIGYNYLVISAPGVAGVDGLIFEGRGRDVVGAHCLNWNTPWIGIQVAIGGDQTPSPAALVSVKWLHVGFVAAAQHALGQVGHKDGFNTACPGPLLYAWVHAGMPVAGPVPPTPPSPPKPAPKPVPTRNIPMTMAIQRAVHVTADGAWGDQTSAAATAVIRNNGDVKYRQTHVGAYPDGVWGPKSQAARTGAIKAIQTAIGAGVDGVWGPESQGHWNTAYAANYHRY